MQEFENEIVIFILHVNAEIADSLLKHFFPKQWSTLVMGALARLALNLLL